MVNKKAFFHDFDWCFKWCRCYKSILINCASTHDFLDNADSIKQSLFILHRIWRSGYVPFFCRRCSFMHDFYRRIIKILNFQRNKGIVIIDIQLTLSISNSQGTRKFVRDRERQIGYSLHEGTETLVRHRERFEIEGVRDRESQLYQLLSNYWTSKVIFS